MFVYRLKIENELAVPVERLIAAARKMQADVHFVNYHPLPPFESDSAYAKGKYVIIEADCPLTDGMFSPENLRKAGYSVKDFMTEDVAERTSWYTEAAAHKIEIEEEHMAARFQRSLRKATPLNV